MMSCAWVHTTLGFSLHCAGVNAFKSKTSGDRAKPSKRLYFKKYGRV